jgi:hypothetical protein
MILLKETCKTCGNMAPPTEVCCDKCQRKQLIEDFKGIVIHFEDEGFEGDCEGECNDCNNCDQTDTGEFQFCDIKCLAEYIVDPNSDSFSKFDEKAIAIYADPVNASLLLYALGRCDYAV